MKIQCHIGTEKKERKKNECDDDDRGKTNCNNNTNEKKKKKKMRGMNIFERKGTSKREIERRKK